MNCRIHTGIILSSTGVLMLATLSFVEIIKLLNGKSAAGREGKRMEAVKTGHNAAKAQSRKPANKLICFLYLMRSV